MNVLVLGGSVFLGRAVVSVAQEQGAEVAVFHRGVSGSEPAGAEVIHGDRTASLDALRGRRFDIVIDTSGYVPEHVAASAGALADTCGRYVFVSTANVYPGWPEAEDPAAGGVYPGDPDAGADDVPEEFRAEAGPYGWLKAGCELAAARAFGAERTTVLRAGAIVGPDDSAVGRLPWWIDRVARGGEVLVPGAPSAPVSLLDARDLARFALTAAGGTFDVHGRPDSTRAELMAACAAATGAGPRLTYVEDGWLAAQGVESWTEVPLWANPAEAPALWWAGDRAAAVAAGLTWRPPAETVADTWAWMQAVPGGWQPGGRTPGLAPERERDLLARWHAR